MKSNFLTKAKEDPNVFKGLGVDTYEYLESMHNQPGRYYHNWNHIDEVIAELEEWHKDDLMNDDQLEILLITALYHDIVYDPKRSDNEELSAAMIHNTDVFLPTAHTVHELILFTKYQRNPENDLEEIFACCDMHIFEENFSKILEFEKAIQQEYSWVPLSVYVPERIKVLQKLKKMTFGNDENTLLFQKGINDLINYLENKKWNIGIYFGSFNPLHKGHKSIIQQAELIFDKVILAQGISENIKSDIDQKIEWTIENEIIQYTGLITDFIKEYPYDITIIRGIRNNDDLTYEQTFNKIIKDILPSQKFIYLFSDFKYNHISSSTIRKLVKYDKNLITKYL